MESDRVLIIGSGISAMYLAHQLADEKNVILLTKGKLNENNSLLAQGGVAAAIDPKDSWENHFNDTIKAGYNIANPKAVEQLVRKGPQTIQKIINNGFLFDQDQSGVYELGKEGAHSHRRILHAGGDQTGKKLMAFFTEKLPNNVQVLTNHTVINLLVKNNKCFGAVSVNEQGQISHIYAEHVVLATGGCGGLYNVTSNDPSITGDGLALAYRAGAKLVDLEFIQFHPTLLLKDNQSFGLISEAVRGEGAKLVTASGNKIMQDVHSLSDLAPRDVVARTIQSYLTRGEKVFLDITMIPDFCDKFPAITAICEHASIDLSKGMIPVAPGAHFLMGGVKTNLSGETSVSCLYAIGEVAATGAHGANRLASNSLLEALVFANQAAQSIQRSKSDPNHMLVNRYHKPLTGKMRTIDLPRLNELQLRMTSQAGMIRSRTGLEEIKVWLESYQLHQNVNEINPSQLRIFNQLLASWLIVTSALARTESRGAHWRSDYPYCEAGWRRKQVIRFNEQLLHQRVGGER